MFSATYSPEDNKLRLYASSRLDSELYARVKAAGFHWAPRQDLFVAPMWTPQREDLLLELCGEIGDEDTSLVDRAEERADRFSDYSDSRAKDADQAHKAVAAIADNIPLGQPILVGHHSERHARKDAQKIENGMRRAVKMWETSKYWTDRAAGAIRHAKYKERPDVRERRIKTIEADIRRMRAEYTPQDNPPHIIMQHGWNSKPGDPAVPHVWCGSKGRGGKWVEQSRLPGIEAHYKRWIAHCERRLEYERAMLGESGGPAADRWDIQVGGKVLHGSEWTTVLRVTKKNGKIFSVRTTARYCSLLEIERVKDYQPPTEEEAAKAKTATKLAPLTNFPTDGNIEMTTAEWTRTHNDYKGTRTAEANEKHGRFRYRMVMRRGSYVPVFITDAKRVDAPQPALVAAEKPTFVNVPVARQQPTYTAPQATIFDAMREQLREGVKVVSAPQLFPTPADLARRMIELANLEDAQQCEKKLRILEPSAGTGALLSLLPSFSEAVAVELNHSLALALSQRFQAVSVRHADFLECNGDLGTFDRILMNPPFSNGQDIKHIRHAMTLLKPDGILVAICANGPRQNEALRPLVEERGGEWEELPPDTFKDAGTGVNTVLLTIPGGDA